MACTYHSLDRLLASNGNGWGEQYGSDSFGKLLSKAVTSGSSPTLSVGVDPATTA
jgi:hypothetical protein